MKKIRFGITGSGYMGRTHAEAVQYHRDTAELVAIWGGSRAASLAQHCGVVAEPTMESLMARKDIDAIIITTPQHVHCQEAVLAMQSGKHVLVEKPMATKVEDCDRMLAAAAQHKRVMSLAYNLRFRINLPNVECIAVSSNAEAARLARHADDAGAIAGETAGRVYGLKTVAQAIEDRADNTTRFLVIGRSLFPPSGNDRTSLLITVNDQPGALYHVLSPFAAHGVSLNRIESRPAHSGKWQYAFFIDVSGHIQDEALQAAVKEIERSVAQLRVLGSYPVALP